MIKITDDIFIDPTEVASVERDTTYKYSSPSPSDTTLLVDFDGSKIFLKNGRKVFVRNIFPKEIMQKLGLLPKDTSDVD